MLRAALKKGLRFYFITDAEAPLPIWEQVAAAIAGGATMVQFRHKSFGPGLFDLARSVRILCRANDIPFIVNDDIILACALAADGVHLGQEDAAPADARRVLGEQALVGLSVSTAAELARLDTTGCDYLGTGPVFATASKENAKPVIGLDGLRAMAARAPVPVVAIGGIDQHTAAACLEAGAAGVAVISCVSRAADPRAAARELARACGRTDFSPHLSQPWSDEFGLIDRLLDKAPLSAGGQPAFSVPPGDDAAVLQNCVRPVISTDAHIEGVHFHFSWQTPEDVGRKAAVTALSDLAAAYARPRALFVNLTLPADAPESLARALYRGLNRALEEYDCALGGGNLSAGQAVELNLFVVGDNDGGLYPARANARPGQDLYCTGRLGLARAGLELLRQKRTAPEELIAAFTAPRARFDAAAILADSGVDCVIDLSDGLAGDAGHIARAAGITIALELAEEVYDPVLLDYCAAAGVSPEAMVLAGGEDYELLFACDPERVSAIAGRLPGLCRVGCCRTFTGEYLVNLPPDVKSFHHGQRKEPS